MRSVIRRWPGAYVTCADVRSAVAGERLRPGVNETETEIETRAREAWRPAVARTGFGGLREPAGAIAARRPVRPERPANGAAPVLIQRLDDLGELRAGQVHHIPGKQPVDRALRVS
jgi:hypothetical protein